MSRRLDQFIATKDKAGQRKHSAKQQEKRYAQEIRKLKRNERTHRLCTRGAYPEKLLQEPDLLTSEDVFAILDYAFNTPYVKVVIFCVLLVVITGTVLLGMTSPAGLVSPLCSQLSISMICLSFSA